MGNSSDATMLSARMPKITSSEAPGPISMPQKVLSIIFTPMNAKRMPKPVLSLQNMFMTLLSMKNRERSPMMAKMLEKNTMYGSWVTEKMAGMESTAKRMSENSMTSRTRKRVVTKSFPSFFTKKLCPL